MDRLIAGLAFIIALGAALAVFRPPSPDRCSDARRLARDVQAALHGAVVEGVYYLPPTTVNATGLYCWECLAAARVATANSTTLQGRVRLLVYSDRSGSEAVVIFKYSKQ
ncbi:hypothetical protein MA03_07290 [Infirmifilum uzonense]|uniref:Uncharacterized protein n=1 Tax=Infirmifilum uzonense TaxID=1550241 RepID=A0A0F7FJA2_9CREN|nr:hypothetical protein [Infirmifilum uzonense]AKG39084.1 hypothetical protein MA03_07290 [Infirmifilum uzonense]